MIFIKRCCASSAVQVLLCKYCCACIAVQVLLCKYQGNSWTATKLCGTCHQLCRRSFSHFLFCQNLSLLWFIIHFWLGNTSYEKIISGISWMGGGPCSKSLPLLSPSNCPLHLDIKVMLCVYFLVIFNTKIIKRTKIIITIITLIIIVIVITWFFNTH